LAIIGDQFATFQRFQEHIMTRGLAWLVFLAIFIGLAWAGWDEFQKLQAYERWAADFDRAKYDIRAILGQKGQQLTWGKPSRQGIKDSQTILLSAVSTVQLLINGEVADPLNPPAGKQIELELLCENQENCKIPFTDSEIAIKWGQVLTIDLQKTATNEIHTEIFTET
jgi:hypothetical protein